MSFIAAEEAAPIIAEEAGPVAKEVETTGSKGLGRLGRLLRIACCAHFVPIEDAPEADKPGTR